ncbi:MAG TPA: hypothetical protein PK307_13310 [Spirochaetota bacterium]|nr:hypothetical protein [Spirochaetota bacterium]HOD13659.1 hypothetical protein [Spirochaetota bacterium]HPG50800.1 hypothetical protein [Spirochaetota bacterium]HPN12717.1 hypothetical protein [Spirochaetota bacterium]HQL83177.1 hypothetical protein [Spirochaetota bacterium]
MGQYKDSGTTVTGDVRVREMGIFFNMAAIAAQKKHREQERNTKELTGENPGVILQKPGIRA